MGLTNAIDQQQPSAWDVYTRGIGLLFQPFPAAVTTTTATMTTQVVRGTACPGTTGSTITGIETRLAAAAAGTLPSLARFGLADSTGKILALSANVSALANWIVGPNRIPLAAPVTLTATGIYFPCLVVNGTWGTTQPTVLACAVAGNALGSDGAFPPPGFQWAGQADLPAVGASMVITATPVANTLIWLGLY